jgi:UDP-N-acetylmuramyl pentapeptide phosphotransferase/UDP-N-acetylglucosamine-1-phosphate transferase
LPELQELGLDQAAAQRGRGLMSGPSAVGLQLGLLAAIAATSAVCTGAWISWAHRRNVVDQPGQRRLHAQATPRGGGVGMAVVALSLLGGLAWTHPDLPEVVGAVALLVGVVFAVLTGLADDLLAMRSTYKLIGQMAAAAAIAWALPWPGAGQPLGWGVSFTWVLVLLNFWNFMDGSNGMVALQTTVVAAALALVLGPVGSMVAFAMAAACVGFLPFNLPKARVFMGDTGSHVLGAMVAILTLWAMRAGQAGLGQVLVLLSAFLLDAGLTLAKRVLQGRRFWQAHREHLYQLAVRSGHSHLRVCAAYAAWGILCAGLALGWGSRSEATGTVLAGVVGTIGAATWVGLRRHWLRRATRMDATA